MRSTSRSERPAGQPAAALSALLIAGLLALPAAAAIQYAPGFVPGRVFDPATSAWERRLISLYRDDLGRITIRGGNGRGRVEVGLSVEEARRLGRAIESGLSRLRQSPAEGDAGAVVELLRIVHGRGVDVHGLAVSLLDAGPEGDGPVLQLFLQDRERPIVHMALYLGPEQAERLDRLLAFLLAKPARQMAIDGE